ncbi:MAG: RNA methyltransferase [Laribacter sp.]|nr:RNA methyltransferase [Laribacter sp.]MBP9526894.1 RNA methyltransferase [Laribacter sp.]MBP9609024.1 RNA methyltransferase [Laribacter sp.]
MKYLTSAQNDTLKSLVRLASRPAERRKSGLLVLEGLHLVDAWLARQPRLEQLFVREDALAHPEVTALLARLSADTPVAVVPAALLGKASELASPAEVIALAPIPVPAPYHGGSVLLLDDVQDPGNLGTLLRTAAAADVRRVYLSAGCADVWSGKALRAGMGAQFALDLHERAALPAVLQAFAGRKVVTHLEGSVPLWSLDLTGDVAFVFGNEGAGVSAAVLDCALDRVIIPMPGVAESLNVAAAAAICLFERVRQCS